MNIYETIEESVNYLKSQDNEIGEYFISSSITEKIIPGTYRPIKAFIKPIYKDLVKSNNTITIMNLPSYRKLYPDIDYDTINPLLDYFEDERKCLISIKRFLNSKIDLPTASYTGIFLTTLCNIHNINTDKINRLNNLNQNGPYTFYLPESLTLPENQSLVNNIDTSINKLLIKK